MALTVALAWGMLGSFGCSSQKSEPGTEVFRHEKGGFKIADIAGYWQVETGSEVDVGGHDKLHITSQGVVSYVKTSRQEPPGYIFDDGSFRLEFLDQSSLVGRVIRRPDQPDRITLAIMNKIDGSVLHQALLIRDAEMEAAQTKRQQELDESRDLLRDGPAPGQNTKTVPTPETTPPRASTRSADYSCGPDLVDECP